VPHEQAYLDGLAIALAEKSMKLDPIDIFVSTSSSMVGRMFQFFAAGWLGLLLGRIAIVFEEPADFLNLADAFSQTFEYTEFADEFLLFLFWPFLVIVGGFVVWIGLGFAAMVFMATAFFTFISDEGPKPIWWLVLVLLTSLLPMWEDGTVWSWGVLVFFWIGLGAFGWWALRSYHPEVAETVDDVMHGRKPARRPTAPPKKAPKNAWGKHARGDWDSGDNEEPNEEEEATP
jgi:hypothetical protein